MKREQPPTIDQRLVRALAHPLRVQILEILSERVASPNRLAIDLETGLSHVAYHTRTLKRCGCLQLVETVQRRGATEHFYKADPRAFVDRSWRGVPRAVRGGMTAASLQSFMDRAVAALEAGTIESREDTTFTWTPAELDERGWNEVNAIMAEAAERLRKAQAASCERLAAERAEGERISAIVGLATFETAGSQEESD